MTAMTNRIDPSALPPEQRERYEWALAEYARIQERNSLAGPNTLAPGLSPLLKHYPSPKSALFARLLSGKPPLPYPPPTSYSYPWYALIDDGYSDNVSLDGFSTDLGKPGVIINQSFWSIVRNNQAAQKLMHLAPSVNPHKRPVLSHEETRLVANALAQAPEWVVQSGRNPEFRLSMARVMRRGRRDLMLNGLLQSDFSGGNPNVIKTIEPLQKTSRPSLDVTTRPQSREDLLDRITDLQLSVDTIGGHQYEWVLVECDGWCLDEVIA
jgi:hypothetical protein